VNSEGTKKTKDMKKALSMIGSAFSVWSSMIPTLTRGIAVVN